MAGQSQENAAVTRRAGIVMVGTLGSRLLGAARDAVIAASFAVGATDIFFVAWTIPNTLRRVLGEGAVSAAYIPVFSKIRELKGLDAARRYTARFAGTMTVILAAVSALGVATAPLWASLYGAGYRGEPDRFASLVSLTQWVFPYILFAGLSALAMGALNAMGRFAIAAFAPAILNVALIAAPFLFVPVAVELGLDPIAGLAIGALVGGVMQVGVQLPALKQVEMRPLPRVDFKDEDVRHSLSLMAPLLLGTGVHQLNILLSRLFASFLPTGSQSFLYYSQRIVEIPQGMFAVAVASAALPSLAALQSKGEHGAAAATFRHSLRISLFIAVPASVAIAVLAGPVVTVLFGRGAFTAAYVAQTVPCLIWLAGGVWAVAAIHPVIRMYHAYGDTRTPVACSAVNLLCFLGVSLLYMERHGAAAIAAASTAAAIAQLAALLVLLPANVATEGLSEVALGTLRHVLAALTMGAVLWLGASFVPWHLGGNAPTTIAGLVLLVVVGACVYAGVSLAIGTPELRDLTSALRRRRPPTPP